MRDPNTPDATYEDLKKVPDNLFAQIVEGVLITMPRPATGPPRTASVDRIQKRRVYAREKVSFMWHIDPLERVLSAYALDGAESREFGVWGGDEDTVVRVAPFDAIELDLTTLWAPRPPEP